MEDQERHDLTPQEAGKLEGLLRARSSLTSFSAGYQAAMRDVQETMKIQVESVGAEALKRLDLDPRQYYLDAQSKQLAERPKHPAVTPAPNGKGKA